MDFTTVLNLNVELDIDLIKFMLKRCIEANYLKIRPTPLLFSCDRCILFNKFDFDIFEIVSFLTATIFQMIKIQNVENFYSKSIFCKETPFPSE